MRNQKIMQSGEGCDSSPYEVQITDQIKLIDLRKLAIQAILG